MLGTCLDICFVITFSKNIVVWCCGTLLKSRFLRCLSGFDFLLSVCFLPNTCYKRQQWRLFYESYVNDKCLGDMMPMKQSKLLERSGGVVRDWDLGLGHAYSIETKTGLKICIPTYLWVVWSAGDKGKFQVR